MPPVNDGPHLCSQFNVGQAVVAVTNGNEMKAQLHFHNFMVNLSQKKKFALNWCLLTASSFLICAIFTIAFTIAQLRFGNAFGHPVSTAAWTQELIVGACDCRTIHFVTLIRAIKVAVTVEVGWYTQRILAPKLATMAGWKICKVKKNKFAY